MQLAGEPSSEEKATAATDAANAFQDYFLINRIWFEPDLVRSLGHFSETIGRIFMEFSAPYDQYMSERLEAWLEAWRLATEDLPPLRENIERSFREILAVGDEE